MTIKATVTAAVLAVLVAVGVASAADNEVQILPQASTGKLAREVSFLVCVNPDQINAAVSAAFFHESVGLLTHGFVMAAESRTSVNLLAVPSMPTVGNFSIAVWTEAADEDTSSASCDVVYYSGVPLREVAREALTVRKFLKR